MPSNEINDIIAQMVLAERRKRGWTQQSLADKAGISRVSVNYVEAGSRKIRTTTLAKLAMAFGLDVEIRFKTRKA